MYAQNDWLKALLMKSMKSTVVALALACFSLAAHAQGRVDIVQIWENFLASGVAANQCGGVDKATRLNFLSNLDTVAIRAAQALEERYSTTVPAAELKNRIVSVPGQISDKVNAEIKQNGCSSPRIQELLKLYKMHATMKLYSPQ